MISFPTILLASLVLLGHAALWVGYFNRVHGIGLAEKRVRLLSAMGHVVFGIFPLVGLWLAQHFALFSPAWLLHAGDSREAWLYTAPWWILGIAAIVLWIVRQLRRLHSQNFVLSSRTSVIDIARRLGHRPVAGMAGRCLARFPCNQMLQLAVHEKELQIERLPAALDGFSIAHLSDLHYTGMVGIEYFQEVVRETNKLQADLIAISGDIADEADCFAWIPETLGQLQAPLGVYFVLGNHDLFHGEEDRLRQVLRAARLTDLGRGPQKLSVQGVDVLLAGNELPWIAPPAGAAQCPIRPEATEQLRILVAHTPDQMAWGAKHDMDLMLAGHTHGGQIRLPLIGPVLSPSLYGVKYAGGLFYRRPTLMHVSRGISADFPLRMNCRPEVTKLTLRASAAAK